MDDDKKLSYFCLGLGIGVAVGVLFAPKSGEETRLLLRSKADESRDLLKRRADEFKGQAGDLVDRVKDQAGEFVDRSKDVITQKKEHLSAAVEAGKQAYREAVAGDPVS